MRNAMVVTLCLWLLSSLTGDAQAGSRKFSFANTNYAASDINDLHVELESGQSFSGFSTSTSAGGSGTNEASYTTVSGVGTSTVNITGVSGCGKPGVLTIVLSVSGENNPSVSSAKWTKDGTQLSQSPAVIEH